MFSKGRTNEEVDATCRACILAADAQGLGAQLNGANKAALNMQGPDKLPLLFLALQPPLLLQPYLFLLLLLVLLAHPLHVFSVRSTRGGLCVRLPRAAVQRTTVWLSLPGSGPLSLSH